MNAYFLTKFVHICAVLAAAAAASLAIFSGRRYARARSHEDATAWLEFNGKVTITFPIVLIVLLLSGSYMVILSGGAYWSTGWVRTGLAAIVLIFASGIFLSARHKALHRRLLAMTDAQKHAHPFHPPRDMALAIMPWMNICLPIGVVFDMSNKPGGADAATIAAISVAVGFLIGYRSVARARAMASVPAPAGD